MINVVMMANHKGNLPKFLDWHGCPVLSLSLCHYPGVGFGIIFIANSSFFGVAPGPGFHERLWKRYNCSILLYTENFSGVLCRNFRIILQHAFTSLSMRIWHLSHLYILAGDLFLIFFITLLHSGHFLPLVHLYSSNSASSNSHRFLILSIIDSNVP